MVRAVMAAFVAAVLLTGCLDPKAEDRVRDWRPLGPGGPTVGEGLAASPYRKAVVFEVYDEGREAVAVRVAVEYDPAGAAALCPAVAPGMARAARVFLLLEFSVPPAGQPALAAARAQTYSAKGHFEEYPLDLGVMAALMAKAFPLPCADLALPDYL